MNVATKTVALMVDGDNVPLKHTKQIIQFCEGYGTLRIKNAYGDWKKPPLSSHHQTLMKLGINPVQQNRVGKNATDFGLAMDVALMLDRGAANIYFIISNDGDFTAVCEQIRLKGAEVYGIGDKRYTSSTLRKSCNKFFYIEEIVKNQSEPSTTSSPAAKPKSPTISKPPTKSSPADKSKTPTKSKPSAPSSPAAKPKSPTISKPPTTSSPAPKPKTKTVEAIAKNPGKPSITPKPKTIRKMLTQAYQKTPNQGGWVLLAQLGSALRKLDTQFDQRFANKKLSDWLKDFPDQFEVENGRVRMK